MKILIVDEIGFIRQSLNQKLSSHGFSVVTAESGEEALSILNMDFSIDTVLTSLFLPTMNALDLYKEASKIERLDDEGTIPPLNFYLMVTREHGSSSPKMKELSRDALALGFRDLFIKPIDVELVVRKLQNSEPNMSTTPIESNSSAVPRSTEEDSKPDLKNNINRIDEISEVKNGLNALKKDVCTSIDSLLEEVNKIVE